MNYYWRYLATQTIHEKAQIKRIEKKDFKSPKNIRAKFVNKLQEKFDKFAKLELSVEPTETNTLYALYDISSVYSYLPAGSIYDHCILSDKFIDFRGLPLLETDGISRNQKTETTSKQAKIKNATDLFSPRKAERQSLLIGSSISENLEKAAYVRNDNNFNESNDDEYDETTYKSDSNEINNAYSNDLLSTEAFPEY